MERQNDQAIEERFLVPSRRPFFGFQEALQTFGPSQGVQGDFGTYPEDPNSCREDLEAKVGQLKDVTRSAVLRWVHGGSFFFQTACGNFWSVVC